MRHNRRLAQVNNLLRETIGQILVQQNSDPVLAALTVTEVRVSKDLSHAKVFLMCHRPIEGEEQFGTQDHLAHAEEVVQKHLAPQIHLKRTPKLHFEIDETEENAERIERLLDSVKQDWQDAERNTEC